jgi:hypothetical protein
MGEESKPPEAAAQPARKGIWNAATQDRSRPMGRVRSYLYHTAGPLTGFLMGFPLTLVYATGSAIRGPEAANDFFTKAQFDVLGSTGYLLVQAGLVLAFLIVILVMQRRGRFEWRYFGPLLLESLLYCVLVVALLHLIESGLSIVRQPAGQSSLGGELLAAFGEAVNEETFFRWLLIPGLLWGLKKLGMTGTWSRGLVGLVLSSVIYALVAYFTGSGMGDTRTAQGFVSFLAVGFLFGGLFLLRGYTIVAYTHLCAALYWAVSTRL